MDKYDHELAKFFGVDDNPNISTDRIRHIRDVLRKSLNDWNLVPEVFEFGFVRDIEALLDELLTVRESMANPRITVTDFEVKDGVRIIKNMDLHSVSVNSEVLNVHSKPAKEN